MQSSLASIKSRMVYLPGDSLPRLSGKEPVKGVLLLLEIIGVGGGGFWGIDPEL